MADPHASEDLRNVSRTVLTHLDRTQLGATLTTPADARFNSKDHDRFVRARVEVLAGTFSGRVAGKRALRHPVLVTAECYARDAGADGRVTTDDVEGVATKVMHALTLADLPLYDYVTDPTGATAVSGVTVRFGSSPSSRVLPPLDGWQRCLVEARGEYFSRLAE